MQCTLLPGVGSAHLTGRAANCADAEDIAAFWDQLLPHTGQLFRSWNPANDATCFAGDWHGLLGMDEPPVGGLERWVQLIYFEDQEAFRRVVAASAERESLYQHEYRLFLPDGTMRTVREYGCRRQHGIGDEGTLLALVTDISEVRQAENQLQHLHKMEAFSRLVGGVAHDFNNLLTIITGYTEMMLEDAAVGDLNPYLAEVQLAAQRAAALTSQLLAFNQPPADLRMQTFDLNDVLRETGKMLRRMLAPQVEFESVPSEKRCPIKAVRARWDQGIIEMGVLAHDLMPQGGSLRMSVSQVEAAPEALPDFGAGVLLTIRGVARGETTCPPHRGLKFLHALEFVRQSGGSICTSDEATLVYLPENPSPLARGLGVATVSPRHGHETILVVEVDTTVRRLAARALGGVGYSVLEARTAEDALALSQNPAAPKPDLLLTNEIMPGLGGRELATELAMRDPALRVLFTSDYPSHSQSPIAGLEGRSGLLQKPFTRRSLLSQVRGLLDRPVPAAA